MEDTMKQLARILSKETDELFIENVLIELFTPDEMDMIRQRLKIVTLLKCKIPQYEVAKRLNASLCSITRGAKELKKPDSALSVITERYLIPESDLIHAK